MNEFVVNLNPWWKTGRVDKTRLGYIKRDIFTELEEALANKKILGLLGPRRSGKTTLLYELVHAIIEKKVDPRRILFLSFDSPKVRQLDFDTILKDLAELLGEPLQNLSVPVYIFLDEIHKWPDWSNKIKYWYELGYKLKFTISGSSAARILRGTGESLLGRINFQMLSPLTFREFLNADRKNISIPRFTLSQASELKKAYQKLSLFSEEIQISLRHYLIKGGFPEVFAIKDINTAYEILRNYKVLAINRDILEIKDIKEPRVLDDLFDLLTDYMSQRINYSQFASILKVKVDTIKKYFSYLEEIYLIYPASVYSRSQIINTRKEKKLFFHDPGIRNALLLREIDAQQIGYLSENAVFIHLLNQKKRELFPKIFYWLTKERQEVDLIYISKHGLFPIEVKYTTKIKPGDLGPLNNFSAKFKTNSSFIITKNIFHLENNICQIPLWLFLLSNLP